MKKVGFEHWWWLIQPGFENLTGVMQAAFKELARRAWNAGRKDFLKEMERIHAETLSSCAEDKQC